MKKLCAWCNKFLGGDDQAPIVSHGICADCIAKYFPESSKCSEAKLTERR